MLSDAGNTHGWANFGEVWWELSSIKLSGFVAFSLNFVMALMVLSLCCLSRCILSNKMTIIFIFALGMKAHVCPVYDIRCMSLDIIARERLHHLEVEIKSNSYLQRLTLS